MRAETTSKEVFFLSPANLSGRRADLLVSPKSQFELAVQLRTTGAAVGDIFSFVSGLYFRGKLAYANTFSEIDLLTGLPAVFVITSMRGLMSPSTLVNLEDLVEMAAVPISSDDPRYHMPLHRDASNLAKRMTDPCQVVLLGSVATSKYIEPLISIFGRRLVIPASFVGMGDMSRGSLLLRAARRGAPLAYINAPEPKVTLRPQQSLPARKIAAP